jgi:hypothetical protein
MIYQEGPFNRSVLSALVFKHEYTSKRWPGSTDVLNSIYTSLMNTNSDFLEVKYRPPKRGFGNLVPDGCPSIKALPNELRQLITTTLIDIDMVCSGINIMAQVFERNNIPCPNIQDYLANREDFLDLISPDRQTAKKTIDSVFNGGFRKKTDHSQIESLFDEFESVTAEFYWKRERFPQYKHIEPVIDKPTLKGRIASYVSLVKDFHQAEILQSMIECIVPENVSTLINDGVLVRNAVDLSLVEKHVLDKNDFKIVLKQKPFERSQELLPSRTETGINWGQIPCFNHSLADMATYTDIHDVVKHSMNPISFKPGVKCLMYNCHMGGGKTYAVKAYTDELRIELGREPEVIIITARCLQAKENMIGYRLHLPGVVHYKDVRTTEELHDATSLICQYESLHKLKGRDKPYDLFIFDECRQVASQTCSVTTNGSNLMGSFEVLRALLEGMSDRCILLDADIEFDGMIRDLVKATLKPSQVEMHRYVDYQPLARNVLILDSQADLITEMDEFITLQKQDVRVFCTFRQKSVLQTVATRLQSKFKKLKLLCIFDDCPVADLECVKDIDAYLREHDINIMMITSKITVGLDIQTLFDRIYAFSEGFLGCTAMNTSQMIARVRCVSDRTVRMCVGGDMYNKSVMPYTDAVKSFLDDKGKRILFAADLTNSVKWCRHQKKWKFIEGLHETMFGWTRALEMTSYQFSFEKLCYMKNWTIISLKLNGDKKKKHDELMSKSRREVRKELRDKYVELLMLETGSTVYFPTTDDDQKRLDIRMLMHEFGYHDLSAEQQIALVEKLVQGDDILDLVKNGRKNIAVLHENRWYTDVFLKDPTDIVYMDAVVVSTENKAANFARIRGDSFKKIKSIIDTLPEIFTTDDIEKLKLTTNKALKPRARLHRLLSPIGLGVHEGNRVRDGDGSRIRHYHIEQTYLASTYASYVQNKTRKITLVKNYETRALLDEIVARAAKSASIARVSASLAALTASQAVEVAEEIKAFVDLVTPDMIIQSKKRKQHPFPPERLYHEPCLKK